MNDDPTSTMFVKFFGEKYLPPMDKYTMVTPVRLHCVQVKHTTRNYNQQLGINISILYN